MVRLFYSGKVLVRKKIIRTRTKIVKVQTAFCRCTTNQFGSQLSARMDFRAAATGDTGSQTISESRAKEKALYRASFERPVESPRRCDTKPQRQAAALEQLPRGAARIEMHIALANWPRSSPGSEPTHHQVEFTCLAGGKSCRRRGA